MMSLFSIFKIMEPQENFMVKPYDLGEYKLTWMLVVTFPAMHNNFMYIKHAYFVIFMKYILEVL